MLGDGSFDFWGVDMCYDDEDGTSVEDDEFIKRMWEEDEEELMAMKKRRNHGRRPGGTNRSGRP